MKDYVFKYGGGSVTLPLDESNVIGELHGHDVPPIEDIGGALRLALDEPIYEKPLSGWLRPGDKVTLIISDMSRFWMRQDLVIPHLIDYMNSECGIADSDIAILVANGTHIGGDEKELRALVTSEIYDRIAVVNHDCLSDELVYFGTTSLGTEVWLHPLVKGRKVVALGAATQHVMAGYGGGRKSILPGVASMKTIQQNHGHSLDPELPCSNPAIGNRVVEGNPLHRDMCEAAAMVEQLYVISLVMNADMKLAKIFAGHWLRSWEEACRAADAIYAVPVAEQADVIVTSCGGFPKDMSLYQGTKTIDNVESGLKEGGTLALIAECRDGGGPEEYFGWVKPLTEGSIVSRLREDFTIPGYVFFLNCEQARKYNIMLLTKIPAQTVLPMGIKAYDSTEALMSELELAGKKVYVIPNGSTVMPIVE